MVTHLHVENALVTYRLVLSCSLCAHVADQVVSNFRITASADDGLYHTCLEKQPRRPQPHQGMRTRSCPQKGAMTLAVPPA